MSEAVIRHDGDKENTEFTHQDDDLLFEMEDEELDRRRSQSYDSFRSDQAFSEISRESSLAPQIDRTESLRITTFDRLGRDGHHSSLPRSSKQNIPSINFQCSVPVGGGHVWEDYTVSQTSRECSSSLSSVEEATEEQLTPSNHSNARRRSNNLDISDNSFISKSPRFLPKFLRASFSKLISKEKGKTLVPRTEPMSLPFFSTSTPATRSPSLTTEQSPRSLDCFINDTDNEADIDELEDCSPTTKQFVEDSLAKGLPIIPFYYSTAEIVEKRRQEKRNISFRFLHNSVQRKQS